MPHTSRPAALLLIAVIIGLTAGIVWWALHAAGSRQATGAPVSGVVVAIRPDVWCMDVGLQMALDNSLCTGQSFVYRSGTERLTIRLGDGQTCAADTRAGSAALGEHWTCASAQASR